MISKSFFALTVVVAALASAHAQCNYKAPSVIFPAGAVVGVQQDREDMAKVLVLVNMTALDVNNYHYFVMATSKHRGTMGSWQNDQDGFSGINSDNTPPIDNHGLITQESGNVLVGATYRTISELLYGTNTGELGSTTFTDLQSNTDGTDGFRVAEASALEKFQIILGASSKCNVGRNRNGGNDGSNHELMVSDADIFIRALYEVQATMTYRFVHDIDETAFSAELSAGGEAVSGVNDPSEPFLIQHADVGLQSTSMTAQQVVARHDIVIESSLTPQFPPTRLGEDDHHFCLDGAADDELKTTIGPIGENPSATSYLSGACSFTARISAVRMAPETPQNNGGDPVPDYDQDIGVLTRNVVVQLWMSQFFQAGENPYPPANSPFDSAAFDPTSTPVYAEAGNASSDMRHDICAVYSCMDDSVTRPDDPDQNTTDFGLGDGTTGFCSNFDVVNPDVVPAITVQHIYDQNDAVAICSFQPFAGDSAWLGTGQISYSPYAYVRAWFAWDNDVADSVKTGAAYINDPENQYTEQPTRRLLRSAAKAKKVAKKVPESVRHQYRFKIGHAGMH